MLLDNIALRFITVKVPPIPNDLRSGFDGINRVLAEFPERLNLSWRDGALSDNQNLTLRQPDIPSRNTNY